MPFHFLHIQPMKRASCVCGEAAAYGDEDGPEALLLPRPDFPLWPLCAPRPLAVPFEGDAEPPRLPTPDDLPPETVPRCSSRMLDALILPAARLTRALPLAISASRLRPPLFCCLLCSLPSLLPAIAL